MRPNTPAYRLRDAAPAESRDRVVSPKGKLGNGAVDPEALTWVVVQHWLARVKTATTGAD